MKKKRRKRYNYSSFKNGKRIHKETRIERRMRFMLKLLNIDFVPEKEIKFDKFTRYYDFFCFDTERKWRFVIECHGDYFHAAEYHEGDLKFGKLRKVQKRNVKNDQLKQMILNKLNIPLLVFWEKQILKEPRFVIKQIKAFIQKLNAIEKSD